MIVGILGGTFDPPHQGHLGVAQAALESDQVEVVWIVPCLRHVFGKQPAAFEHRMAMCEILARDVDQVLVSAAEAALDDPGQTLGLVQALKRDHPDHRFRLVAGADIYHERHKWHRFDEVAQLAPPIYVGRLGVDPIPEPTLPAPPDISSSALREQLLRRERPSVGVPEPILDYIETHRLYGWSE
jgi:nicotinate-nucleotide adenylyltransferase